MSGILLADSGSTKTEWRLIKDGSVERFVGEGLNPNTLERDEILEILEDTFKLGKPEVDRIDFYGAGCSNTHSKVTIKSSLRDTFGDVEINISTDLIAACKSLDITKAGWACILGTGSNACIYDGQDIVWQQKSLGYLLGDEGSGCDLGKKLVKAYFLNQMSEETKKAFEQDFSVEYSEYIQSVYHSSKPNTWLASFAPFAIENKNNTDVKKIVYESMNAFIKNYILPYPNHEKMKVNFVGSIAFYFKEIIENVLKEHRLELGIIVRSPIDQLVESYR